SGLSLPHPDIITLPSTPVRIMLLLHSSISLLTARLQLRVGSADNRIDHWAWQCSLRIITITKPILPIQLNASTASRLVAVSIIVSSAGGSSFSADPAISTTQNTSVKDPP